MKTKKCSTCAATNKNIATTKVATNNGPMTYIELMKIITKNIALPDLNNAKVYKPKDSNYNLELDLGKKNAKRYIFYFAAKPNKISNCDRIRSEKYSYGFLRNQGLTMTDNDGKCKLSFKCPQAYRDVKATYLPHVHFLIANKDNLSFNLNIKTHSVSCEVTLKQLKEVIKNDCALIINALPYEYYIKSRIPNSISLPYTYLKEGKLSQKEVENYIKTMLVHSKKISNAVKTKKIKFHDIPIIVYCWDRKCEADHICVEHLHKFNFTNIRMYADGITGWNKSK